MNVKRKRPKQRVVGKQERAERHEMFCLEYSKDLNAARAAIAAGYAEKAAKEKGYKLLQFSHIKSRIKKIIDERMAKTLLEGDEILLETKKLAVSDIRRLFNHETGALLPMAHWPDDVARAVASVKVKELYNREGELFGFIKEVKLWDKPKPLEMLGKNKKLFTDVVETKGEHQVTVVDPTEVGKVVDDVEHEF